MNDSRIRASVAAKIKDLYTITNDLEEMLPGHHFTLDGHLVGSIGEERNILANPFKCFEDMQMMHHTKTLGICAGG
ncbi:DUF6998 domain-containing protein [Caproiciproducens sp.]|uniref:DUF6998 domain-containing protein n=1 Tax=Caproiciproducens sp. TaxID=1954376 RepID=UPI0028A29333|nr:hypothetical protein [Caproiciproducens sp.]